MEQRLAQLERDVKLILEHVQINEAREKRRGAILDRMVDDELARDELYKDVRKHIYGTGIVALCTTVAAMLFYAVKAWLEKQS